MASTEYKDNHIALSHQLPIGVYRTTEDGRILYANNALVCMLGYDNFEDLASISVYDTYVNKEERDKAIDRWRNSSAMNTVEQKLKKKNGDIIWVRDIGQVVKDENGEILYFDGVIEDITQYKKAEDALRRSEEKYKSLTKQLPLGVYRTSKDGKFLFANPTLINILGFKDAEELLGTNARNIFYDPSDRDMQLKNWILSTDIHSDELRFKRKDGTIIWVRDTGKAILNDEGEIEYFDGIIQDITNIKAAQDALKESEGTTRAILNSSVDAIVLLNKEGIIIDCNDTIVKYTKSEYPEVIGKSYYSLFDGDTAEKRKSAIDSVFKNKQEVHFDNKVENIIYENHIFPIHDKDNEVTKVVVFSKNITRQKQNEQDLIKAKEQAEEADKLKSAFLANMSHEIRTPMNSIIGFSKLIDNPKLNESKRKQFTKIIRERTKDLLQIIDEILDISKIESGQMPITESVVSLNHILDEMYNFFFTKIKEEKKKDLNITIKKSFRTSDGNIIADGVKLKQILINLIDNAIKFTNQGDVVIGCRIENSEIVFYIKDTGIGISKNKLGIIFERFRQSEEFSTRKYGGPGLGLAISKGLVELLHGKIWVESVLGVGSTFYFTIPYRKNDSAPADSTVQKRDERYNWSDYSILIVEDDNISQEYLAEVVYDTGVKLLFAENGHEAITIVKEEKVDLILMDIQLPEIDGYETTRKIKKLRKDIPILAQTAFAMEQDRIKCFDAGCDDFITKPIDSDALLVRISKYFKLQ